MGEKEINKAKNRIVTLTSSELLEMWNEIKFKPNSTTSNALAILVYLQTPLTYEDLFASEILMERTLPKPHNKLFYTLATRQETNFLKFLPEADEALDRDKKIRMIKRGSK